MPSRSRDRHLAKQAERRRHQRLTKRRSRNAALGVGGAVAGALLVVLGLGMLAGRDRSDTSASPTPSPSEAVDERCSTKAPKAAGEKKPTFDEAPDPAGVLEEGMAYTAVVETSCGTVTVELDAEAAPATVASFVFLAGKGYFDGLTFHRVVDGIDVVQSGDPKGDGTGGPGYTIPDELAGGEHYAPGSVAMANAGADTGGSQFFWITGPEGANLDDNPDYTIFGTIVDGLGVAKIINSLMPTHDGTYDGPPTQPVYIESVTIETKPER
jgi:cyclophilin family peptidyl-prolyl cis-trans isomerase